MLHVKQEDYPASIPRRLSKEGADILRGFFENTSRYPTERDKNALLAQIRSLEGYTNYPIGKISAWFIQQRARCSRQVKANNASSILFPSLTKSVISRLEVLLQSNPYPNHAVMAIWASRLGTGTQSVPVADVQTWVELQKAQNQHYPPQQQQQHTQQFPQPSPSDARFLPTIPQLNPPGHSISPEPILSSASSPVQSSFKFASISPTISTPEFAPLGWHPESYSAECELGDSELESPAPVTPADHYHHIFNAHNMGMQPHQFHTLPHKSVSNSGDTSVYRELRTTISPISPRSTDHFPLKLVHEDGLHRQPTRKVIPPPRIGIPLKMSDSQLPSSHTPSAGAVASTLVVSTPVPQNALEQPSVSSKQFMNVRQILLKLHTIEPGASLPVAPKSAAEWEALFAPFEVKMKRIIKVLDSQRLDRCGEDVRNL